MSPLTSHEDVNNPHYRHSTCASRMRSRERSLPRASSRVGSRASSRAGSIKSDGSRFDELLNQYLASDSQGKLKASQKAKQLVCSGFTYDRETPLQSSTEPLNGASLAEELKGVALRDTAESLVMGKDRAYQGLFPDEDRPTTSTEAVDNPPGSLKAPLEQIKVGENDCVDAGEQQHRNVHASSDQKMREGRPSMYEHRPLPPQSLFQISQSSPSKVPRSPRPQFPPTQLNQNSSSVLDSTGLARLHVSPQPIQTLESSLHPLHMANDSQEKIVRATNTKSKPRPLNINGTFAPTAFAPRTSHQRVQSPQGAHPQKDSPTIGTPRVGRFPVKPQTPPRYCANKAANAGRETPNHRMSRQLANDEHRVSKQIEKKPLKFMTTADCISYYGTREKFDFVSTWIESVDYDEAKKERVV